MVRQSPELAAIAYPSSDEEGHPHQEGHKRSAHTPCSLAQSNTFASNSVTVGYPFCVNCFLYELSSPYPNTLSTITGTPLSEHTGGEPSREQWKLIIDPNTGDQYSLGRGTPPVEFPEPTESLADTESVSEEGSKYDPYDSDQKRKKRHRGKKERNTSNRNLIDYEVIPRIQSSRQEVTKGKKVLNKHKKPHMDTPTNHPPRHNRGGRGGGGGRGRGRDARAPNPAGAQTHR